MARRRAAYPRPAPRESFRAIPLPPTLGLKKEPRLVVSTPTEEIGVFFRREAAAAGGLNEELRTSSLDTYSRDRIFFSDLPEHRIVEELRDRHVLGQALSTTRLDHELTR